MTKNIFTDLIISLTFGEFLIILGVIFILWIISICVHDARDKKRRDEYFGNAVEAASKGQLSKAIASRDTYKEAYQKAEKARDELLRQQRIIKAAIADTEAEG
jgi:hypothetical protein